MADDKAKAEAGNKQVQAAVQADADKGYRGTPVDRTPNENYTVAGVTAGLPVPETEADPVSARRAAARQHGQE